MMSVFENCLWIGGEKCSQSPLIVRKFNVNCVKDARLFITGLGFFHALINGIPVTEYLFLPVFSDYEKRDLKNFIYPLNDFTTNRIYYYEFNISHLLRVGKNILEIWLGNGFYRQNERVAEGDVSFGDALKTIYKICLDNVVINSDGSESYYDSNIVENNLFYGESVDFNLKPILKNAVIYDSPNSLLTKEIGRADKIVRRIKPKHLSGGIYDAGENISGVVKVTANAKCGEKITLRFAENLNDNGELDYLSTGSDYIGKSGKPQIQEDTFVSDGKTREFCPKFVWHAFRYFEVTGEAEDIEVLVIHSDTPVTSEFESDSEGLNFLYDAFIRTQLNNMHGSIPSDCPHRERLGYTGDGQVCSLAAMLTLDSQEFYRKWIQDILDCQDTVSGHVQHTAPFMGGGGGPGGWGSAIVFVPYNYYLQYGDRDILNECCLPIKNWLYYLSRRLENNLLTREEEGGWCLGDWSALEGMKIPSEYVNTCSFIKQIDIYNEILRILNQKEDDILINLKLSMIKAVKEKFYHDNTFANGVQGADAFAIWCGIAGKETAEVLNERYNKIGYIDTGFIGTDILFEVLFDYGYTDTAMKLLENDKLGSFLYMKRRGATTIWECLNGENSHNHPMFGGCVRQIFNSILGIKQQKGTAGFESIIIDPKIPSSMNFAKGSLITPKGKITVLWKKKDDSIDLEVNVPEDIKVSYGCKKITES